MSANKRDKQGKGKYLQRVLLGFLLLALITVLVFVSAGSLAYWQGWVYCGTATISYAVSAVMFVNKTDLIEERIKPGPGTRWWDKVFFVIYVPAFIAILIVASLDARYHRWTLQLPLFIYALSYTAHVLSYSLILWAMWTNRFFSSVVRVQSDRGQVVVQNGPYRFVRHPGYVGGILLAISTSLVLDSLWGLIPASVVTILLVIRTHLEDAILRKELAGYAGYAEKVKYRLLPGVW